MRLWLEHQCAPPHKSIGGGLGSLIQCSAHEAAVLFGKLAARGRGALLSRLWNYEQSWSHQHLVLNLYFQRSDTMEFGARIFIAFLVSQVGARALIPLCVGISRARFSAQVRVSFCINLLTGNWYSSALQVCDVVCVLFVLKCMFCKHALQQCKIIKSALEMRLNYVCGKSCTVK